MNTSTNHKVDRHSSMPVYQQIASDILARISQEEWCIGDKLPSEGELSEEYSASRVTIRQALAKLESEGLIDKQRGKGPFVKSNPGIVIQDLFIPQVGIKKKSDIVAADIKLSVTTSVSAQILNHLAIEPGTPVVYLERLFLRKGRAIGVNRAWFPEAMVPGMAKERLVNDSITDTLQQRYGIEFSSIENYIEAISMDGVMAHMLNANALSLALKISSIYMNQEGKPVEYAVTVWNGSDTQFHVVLSSKQEMGK